MEDFDFHFEEDTHTYSESGIVYPSVTEAIKYCRLVNYDGIPAAVLERKACIGRLAHQATALWDEDDLDWETLPPEVVPYVEAYAAFRNDMGARLQIVGREKPQIGIAWGMKYGMTPDIVCTIDGEPCIIELKCTAAVHPAWKVQLAGYELGLPKPKNHRGYMRQALQLKPNGKFNLPEAYRDPTDREAFHAALVLTNWKKNNNLKG